MNIEKEFCSAEQGILLQQLGVNEKAAVFSWVWDDLNQKHNLSVIQPEAIRLMRPDSSPRLAISVGGLGILLGADNSGSLDISQPVFEKYKDKLLNIVAASVSEADFRANTLIFMLENGIITAAQANARLAR